MRIGSMSGLMLVATWRTPPYSCGLGGMGVCLGDDGFVWDGHHRIIAAKHLGIPVVPLESRERADARWVRDHGTRSWEERLFGDAVAGEGVRGVWLGAVGLPALEGWREYDHERTNQR